MVTTNRRATVFFSKKIKKTVAKLRAQWRESF